MTNSDESGSQWNDRQWPFWKKQANEMTDKDHSRGSKSNEITDTDYSGRIKSYEMTDTEHSGRSKSN